MTMPNETRYRELLSALRRTKKAIDTAEDDKTRLANGIDALRQVVLFLVADPEVAKEGLIRPLGLIENALLDARQGASPALLDHPPEGPKPRGTAREYVQAGVAWALQLLTSARGGKLGTERAVDRVVAEARKAGLTDPGGSSITTEQVIQWRKDISPTSPIRELLGA
jgi:hypothetical protein